MKKDYISKNVEELFKNDFLYFFKKLESIWIERSLPLYTCIMRILKYISINNNFNDFYTDLDYFLNMYKELKEKELLSPDEIFKFENYLINLNADFTYFEDPSDKHSFICMHIEEYLNQSNFVLDFFKLEREIKNF